MRLFLILACSLCLFMGVCFGGAAAGDATTAVKAVLDRAMDIQTRPELAGEAHRVERVKLIHQLITDSFWFAEMARDSIKENWDRLAAGQRSEFQRLFAQLFQDSYTRMVLNFLQKETIEYRGESQEGNGSLVQTVIMRANEHIPVDYHLSQRQGRWLIRDVEIDGVGIVDNYKNTFRKVIQTSSFDGLLNKMRLQSQAIHGDS
jgi:phospholipid transport system substrate-binding protein